MRAVFVRAAVTTLGLVLSHAVPAQQNFPAKPIHVISPLPPGSGVDTIMRKASDELVKRLGQPLVLENRPGGNMTIGTDLCARSAGDGYTYCLISGSSMSFMPHLFSKMPYDPVKDIRPVVLLFHLIEGIITKADLNVHNAAELRALALANPGKLNFGTLGPDTTTDISRRHLNERWKTDIVGIHYKGGPQIITALAGGEIDFSRIGVFNAISLLKSGRLKILAIGGTRRSPLLPDVPTMDEVGLGGIPPERPWWGLGTQGSVPEALVRRMNGEFVRLFREPAFAEFLDTQYVESGAGSPEAFAAFLKKDRAEAGELVRRFNIPKQ